MSARSFLKDFPTEIVELVKGDGRRFENIVALIGSNGVTTEDVSLPIEAGDMILRPLPNGLIDRFTVTDPGYHQAFGSIPARYSMKVHKETAISPEKVSQSITQHFHGNVGNVATGGSNFQQTATVNPVGQQLNINFDPVVLLDELSRLRTALKMEADEPEHYAALSELHQAEKALVAEDKPKMIDHLKAAGQKAGPWLLNASTAIGTTVAAEVIKALLHLPGN